MKCSYLACVSAVFCLITTMAWAQSAAWVDYVNPRFGAAVSVPADWKAEAAPDNGDGRSYTSPDGKSHITVWGNFDLGDTTVMDTITAPKPQEIVTYKAIKPKLAVLSGTKGDMVFYRKHMLTCHGQVWVNLSMEYPVSMKTELDPVAARLSKSLHQGKPCSDM
jgi:hypothetical protein